MSTLTHNFRNDNCTIMTYIKDKIYISDTPCEVFLISGQYTNNYKFHMIHIYAIWASLY